MVILKLALIPYINHLGRLVLNFRTLEDVIDVVYKFDDG